MEETIFQKQKIHYILLRHGFSNRLRTIAGYAYIADKLNVNIIFHWEIGSPECNGRWDDIFLAYESKNIKIIDTHKNLDINYTFIGQNTISAIILNNAPFLIPTTINTESLYDSQFIKDIELEYYSKFIFNPVILDNVNTFFEKNGNDYNDYVAIHIRRTDHIELAKKNNSYTTFDEFDKFIEDNKEKKIFIATDNLDVQNKYGDKCIYYKKINKSNNLRQTDLSDAVVDILIASKCSKFKGSGYSSYSGLIRIMHKLHNCNKHL